MLFFISDPFPVIVHLRTVIDDLCDQPEANKCNKNPVDRHSHGQTKDREDKSTGECVVRIPGSFQFDKLVPLILGGNLLFPGGDGINDMKNNLDNDSHHNGDAYKDQKDDAPYMEVFRKIELSLLLPVEYHQSVDNCNQQGAEDVDDVLFLLI